MKALLNHSQQMDEFELKGFQATGEAFSIATLMYARMRRVAGRMIDVMYFVENIDYANYVIQLAITMQDEKLDRLVARLQALMQHEMAQKNHSTLTLSNEKLSLAEEHVDNAQTNNKEYQAQISHHYIGALR